MQSVLRSRALCSLLAVSLLAVTVRCVAVDRRGREDVLTSALSELVPDGRFFSNDLSSGKQTHIRTCSRERFFSRMFTGASCR